MADATQELMLRVRGDNSGADKAIANTKTAVEGLKVSGERAAGAFKNFSRGLAESRDASAVAASAASSLSEIVSKSLIGAFAVGGVKLFTDQINRMGEAVKSVATSAQKAFDDIEKAGQAMTLSEAISQVAKLDALLASTGEKLSELDRSPFQNFIAGATGARLAMEELVGTSQKLRDMKLAEGLATENANAELTAGLNEQEIQIAKVNAEYEKRFKIAQTFTDAEAYRIYQEASHALRIRETNAIIDAESEKAAQKKQESTHEQIKLNEDLSQKQIKGEERIAEAQQKRFNDLYSAEVKAQEAMQSRIDANLKAEQELADKRQSLQQDLEKAKAEQKSQSGLAASETVAFMSGGSQSAGAGRGETSFEIGLRKAQERAYQEGKTESADKEIQRTIDEIKKERAAAGDTRFTGINDAVNRLKEKTEKTYKAQGAASSGTEKMAQSVAEADRAIADFAKTSLKAELSTGDFGSHMYDLFPSFDKVMKSAGNLSDSITENSGSMVDDFLSTGGEASDLGDGFSDLGESASDLSERLKKTGGGGGGGGGEKPATKGLGDIWNLLDTNLKEMRTYALVK